MNYLFTAAGKGSRFIKKGIKPPKPLIKVFGDELLIWSMRSFNFNIDDNIFIVSQTSHKCKKFIEKKLNRLFPFVNFYWLELNHLPNGQLITLILALEEFKLSGKLIIHNCDTAFENNSYELNNLFEKFGNAYAFFPVFEAKGDHWSFAKTELNSEKVISISEKKRISNNCSIGTYIFTSASNLLFDAKQYIKETKPNKNLGEYYIAPFLDHMCKKDKQIIISSANKPKLFGNIEELLESFQITFQQLVAENAWLGNQRKTLIVDIDGTICELCKDGDYANCKPIVEVVKKLILEHEKGTYIVLFTARNMRTFKGAIGLINKYTAPVVLEWLNKYNIPYDEIIFGKPWGNGGVSYVDDKNLDPESIS